jgi:hypothetical protein
LRMKNLRTRTCRYSGKISDWRSQNHSQATSQHFRSKTMNAMNTQMKEGAK